MKTIYFDIDSNQEIWEVVDKELEYNLLPQFWPFNRTQYEWWKIDIKIPDSKTIKEVTVRQMQFAILANIVELKKILELQTNQFVIYQFEKAPSESLIIENLPDESRIEILIKNGLKHIIEVRFEEVTISSIDENYINSIIENPKFYKLVEEKKTTSNNS